MYAIDGIETIPSVSPGTSLLASAPPMVGGRELAYRFAATGLDRDEVAIVITTNTSAETVGERLAEYTTSATALEGLGIVDATGQDEGATTPTHRRIAVGSPADLTGIGIAFTKLAKQLLTRERSSVRLVVDSLSTLIVYTDFTNVYRFTHAMVGQVERLDGAGLFLIQSDTETQQTGQIDELFDGRIELRITDDGAEARVYGVGDDTDWHPFDPDGPVEASAGATSPAGTSPRPGADRRGETPRRPAAREGTAAREREAPAPASLHALIEDVTGAGYTLTVYNHTGSEGVIADLQEYFERLNVTVRSATLSTDEPTDVAILHRDADALAMSPVQDLHNAVELGALEDIDVDAELEEFVQPAVLTHAARQQYTVENGGKLAMVRISRLIETRALETGAGELHAGFQRLSRIDDERGTRELYERIAERDVDIHIYGRPGNVPQRELYTTHTADTGELADSWFVVFDGGGDQTRAGALVSEETEPEHFTGFWTFQPSLVDRTTAYLRETYPTET